MDIQMPVQLILDDLGVTALGQFVAFVKQCQVNSMRWLCRSSSLQSICPCTIPNWKLPFRSFPKVMWPGT